MCSELRVVVEPPEGRLGEDEVLRSCDSQRLEMRNRFPPIGRVVACVRSPGDPAGNARPARPSISSKASSPLETTRTVASGGSLSATTAHTDSTSAR